MNPTGQKVMPSVAETLMRIHGTAAGQLAYPNDFYFVAAADGKPTFLLHELLTRQQFHSYFGKTRSDLEKQFNNRVEYERKHAAKAAEEARNAEAEAAALDANPRHYMLDHMKVAALDNEIDNINSKLAVGAIKLAKSGKKEDKVARLKLTSLVVDGPLINQIF